MASVPSDVTSSQYRRRSALKEFTWIGDVAPAFGVNGKSVEVLTEPEEFYDTLKHGIRTAKRRVVLASLYLGTGELEKQLVDTLEETCQRSEEDGGELQVQILLDFNRGSRGTVNSRTMLLQLLERFPNVSVALYHTPDLRGFLKSILPERWNETVGLQHMKVYLFDDSFIISGANLSNDYFIHRQDRYIIVRDCPALADFYSRLVAAVSSASFRLSADNDVCLDPLLKSHPYLDSDNGATYRQEVRDRVQAVINPSLYAPDDQGKIKGSDLHNKNLKNGLSSVRNDGTGSEPIDTWIYPLVQMGPFDIQVDDKVTQSLFERANKDCQIMLASGYFNLTDHYKQVIVQDTHAHFDILTASPQANGFFGARGISGAIPDGYTYIAREFLSEAERSHQKFRINMYEFSRLGWTFHGKGLWYYLPHTTLPSLTLIGSPNFGYRSVFRDLESQLAIVTDSLPLKEQLHQEQEALYQRAEAVTSDTFLQPARQMPFWVPYFIMLMRNYF